MHKYIYFENLLVKEELNDDSNFSREQVNAEDNLRTSAIGKRLWTNVKMSLFQVIVFAVFWAPYVLMHTW